MSPVKWLALSLSLCFPWHNLCEKYILVSTVTTVDIAEQYCNDRYNTSLASIHSKSDNTKAKNLCVSNCTNLTPCKKACSIGANDKQNERGNNGTGWVWNDGSLFNYSNWSNGEPNAWKLFPGGEDCSVIWSVDHDNNNPGTWNDCPCNGTGGYQQRFLCNAPLTTSPTSTPTNVPSINPTAFTNNPTTDPTLIPTTFPTRGPTNYPTTFPTNFATTDPTLIPTTFPTRRPTIYPTSDPKSNPTKDIDPTVAPTYGLIIDAPTEKRKIAGKQRFLILMLLFGLILILCLIIIIMCTCCCKISKNGKWFQKQQKIENKEIYTELMIYNDKPETMPYVTPCADSVSTGLECDILNEDDNEYFDEIGQEDDPLYSKPTGTTKNDVTPSGDVGIIHFYYMDVEQQELQDDDYKCAIELYHEKQKWEMCLMHALNGLLQKQQFTVKSMNAICKELAPQKMINPHKSLLQTGNYDANVLMMALGKMNIEVQWFDSRKKNEFDLNDEQFLQFLKPDNHKFVGFILNKPVKAAFMIKRRHWIAIKEINGEWYNLDSKLKKPEKYKNIGELNGYLVHSLGHNDAELMICRKKKIKNMQQKKVKRNAVLKW